MNESKKLQTLLRIFPYESDNGSNPFGDYSYILQLSARFPMAPCLDAAAVPPALYFAVHKHNGFLSPITQEQFNEACISAAYKQSKSSFQDFEVQS
jgi:hypothetical protein